MKPFLKDFRSRNNRIMQYLSLLIKNMINCIQFSGINFVAINSNRLNASLLYIVKKNKNQTLIPKNNEKE